MKVNLAKQRPLRPIARTLTRVGGAAILAMTLLVTGVFYVLAARQHSQEAARYAHVQAQAIARSIDVFDEAMKITAENAHGVFRKQFAPTLSLLDEATGTLTSFGSMVNDNTAEVDRFAQDFPGGNATIFVTKGEDFQRITTSVKKENGERAVGTLLARTSPAYTELRAGRKFVGRVMLFGKPFMTVYAPIQDDAGRVVGVSYVGLDISGQQARLVDTINNTRVYESGGLYVVAPATKAADSLLVFHPRAAGKKLGEVVPEQAAQWMARLRGDQGVHLSDAPAVLDIGHTGSHFASVARSEATGWLVVAEVRDAEALAALYRQVGVLAAFIAATAGLLGIGLILFIRRVVSPLQGLSTQVQAIGAGDLSRSLDSSRDDEIGVTTRAVEAMRLSLLENLRTVQAASDSIRTASQEIATGNTDLSSRTEEAASSLQQTASSMEQLTGTVKQSADAARQANQLASSASSVASRGGQVVSQVVATMDEINTSSKKIADIIGVIDGIAFQTNILAL
ncbi:Cache 3/Cache 2 fusion domain-containing protein, partial [Caldimonas mangrovi]|uniref:Cache 3/Cache 2 fusion domain-containing protein n=1 Tax=Caldimonas mangrovi TaxID=2944811 RepID=UPI002475EEBB